MPDFAQSEPRDFWAAADEHERKNARLCSEIRLALPKELDQNRQVDLIKSFIAERLIDQPCQWALHYGKGRNPHAHVIFSERKNTPETQYSREVFFKRNGAKKNRDFNAKDWVSDVRESWETTANHHLALAGSKERINHRSLKAQCAINLEEAEEEYKKAVPDQEFIAQKIKAAESLDRDPQEKKRWIRQKQKARLVAYARSKHKPERPQTRMIEEFKGKILSWLIKKGELVITRTKDAISEVSQGIAPRKASASDLLKKRALERSKARQNNRPTPQKTAPRRSRSSGWEMEF